MVKTGNLRPGRKWLFKSKIETLRDCCLDYLQYVDLKVLVEFPINFVQYRPKKGYLRDKNVNLRFPKTKSSESSLIGSFDKNNLKKLHACFLE